MSDILLQIQNNEASIPVDKYRGDLLTTDNLSQNAIIVKNQLS